MAGGEEELVAKAVAHMEWSMTDVIAVVSLVLVLCLIGLVTYVIVRLQKLYKMHEDDIASMKTVIGRMVKEINTINAKKYLVDRQQTSRLDGLAN